MSFDRLTFSKDWTDPTDFPTVETSETQVRADMQLLHDETKNALNALMDSLERGNQDELVRHGSDSAAYIRRTSEGVLETSSDGETWYPIAWGDTVKNHASQHAPDGADPVEISMDQVVGLAAALEQKYSAQNKPTPEDLGVQTRFRYTNPTQFGCTAASTPAEIWDAMPFNSEFLVNAATMTATEWGFPDKYAILHVIKGSDASRGAIFLRCKVKSGGDHRMYLSASTTGPNTNWFKYATTEDLTSKFVFGTYTGNAESTGDEDETIYAQTISLGFTPSAVIVFSPGNMKSSTHISSHTSIAAIPGVPFVGWNSNLLEIVTNGFKVASSARYGSANYYDHANDGGTVYTYIAIK